MEDDFGETSPSSRIITIAYGPSEDELCACAQACHVDREMIEFVFPAHPEQQRRMAGHLEMGSYMETAVFEFDQKLNREQKKDFMIAFEAVRLKHCLMRTRLVKYKEQVLQVVLSDKADWTECGDFSAYRDRNRMSRMDYGRPLFRYAFLEDENKSTYFVWTVNSICLESWMRDLVLNDLQAACWNFSYFMTCMQDQALVLPMWFYDVYWTKIFPCRQYRISKVIDTNPSKFNPWEYTTLPGEDAFEVLHLPVQFPYSDIELSVVGHAAWALACYKAYTTPTINFISVNPASYGDLPRFQKTMGPITKGVQVWVPIERSKKIRELLSDLGNASNGIIGKEHGTIKAPDVNTLSYRMLFRGVFQWDSAGGACPDRMFGVFERGVAPAMFRRRYAQSIPASHDYVLLLNIRRTDGLIEIRSTWDTVLVPAQVEQVFERFIYIFEAIVNGQGDTVGDLLPD